MEWRRSFVSGAWLLEQGELSASMWYVPDLERLFWTLERRGQGTLYAGPLLGAHAPLAQVEETMRSIQAEIEYLVRLHASSPGAPAAFERQATADRSAKAPA